MDESLDVIQSTGRRKRAVARVKLMLGQGVITVNGKAVDDYFARPQDGWKKSVMIWLDKKAVDLYSRAKARFGFSDEFASKVLGFLSRKK